MILEIKIDIKEKLRILGKIFLRICFSKTQRLGYCTDDLINDKLILH